MDETKLEDVILEAAGESKRLTCKRAFELAEEFGVPLKTVGEIADKLEIKIRACQLGCFK